MPIATNADPATAATSPAPDTPPEVPVGTLRQVSIERGSRPTSVPISVAHVSAAAPARAAVPKMRQPSHPAVIHKAAANANTKPFASTWSASRGPLLATTDSVRATFIEARKRVSATDDAKYATSSTAHDHPAATATVPTTVAATAPLADREWARRAASAIAAANRTPTATRVTLSSGAIGPSTPSTQPTRVRMARYRATG